MPFYHQLGEVPQKKHTQFRKQDGSLYWEELFSTKGFSGIYSNLYHIHPPTRVKAVEELSCPALEPWSDAPRQPFHFLAHKAPVGGDMLTGRSVFLYNGDTTIGVASFTEPDERFYRNARADEILFVHRGSGRLLSEYGALDIRQGDYLVIPRGVLYRLELAGDNLFFVVESTNPIETPARYRNEFGQLLETAPFSERDFRRPEFLEPVDQVGDHRLIVKSGERCFLYTLDHHPLDVVGWDGFLYPFAFNIHDFQPIVGQIHQPPPVQQVFHSAGFVVCNFVPRLFDFHPQAIPTPYCHQNVDSDEVLYYVEGEFMSRTGVEEGSITFHPGDVPHGPQPGRAEASLGKKSCHEYAVMVDTFRPLTLTRSAQQTMDPQYVRSWLA